VFFITEHDVLKLGRLLTALTFNADGYVWVLVVDEKLKELHEANFAFPGLNRCFSEANFAWF